MKCWSKDRDVEVNNPMRDTINEAPSSTETALWIPSGNGLKVVHNHAGVKLRTRGEYEDNHPVGSVVHFTAGWQSRLDLRTAVNADIAADSKKLAQYGLEGAKKNGYTFLVIDAMGVVYQNFPLNRWGYHAGKSKWPSIGSSVSNKLIGIEVQCPGRVKSIGNDMFETWYGQKFHISQIRETQSFHNVKKGFYVPFTVAQEEALIKVNRWLFNNGRGIFQYANVLGHDEVAPTRKDDPGLSLSMSMPQFRDTLQHGVAR